MRGQGRPRTPVVGPRPRRAVRALQRAAGGQLRGAGRARRRPTSPERVPGAGVGPTPTAAQRGSRRRTAAGDLGDRGPVDTPGDRCTRPEGPCESTRLLPPRDVAGRAAQCQGDQQRRRSPADEGDRPPRHGTVLVSTICSDTARCLAGSLSGASPSTPGSLGSAQIRTRSARSTTRTGETGAVRAAVRTRRVTIGAAYASDVSPDGGKGGGAVNARDRMLARLSCLRRETSDGQALPDHL